MTIPRDARSLSTEALEGLRRRAVAAVESGKTQSEVAQLLGVSRKTVGAWVRAYRRIGEQSFRPRTRGRRPGEQLALSPAQQAWAVKTVVAGTPDEHGLPHSLWSRQAVAELLNREHRILLSPATVGQYLARWGLLEEPNLKEMMRARVTGTLPRRRNSAIEAAEWIPEGDVLWCAWTRPRASDEHGRIPQRQDLLAGFRNYFGDVNLLQVISNRGVVFFQAQLGPFSSAQTERFFTALTGQFGRPLNVIVCRWPLEHHEILRTTSQRHTCHFSLRFLSA
jgi:transposase